jgi:type VI secretion system secreted protein Hcp
MSFRRVLFISAAVFTCALAASRAQAALDMFLEIPGVAGESTTAGYENQINVLAWSFGGSKYECGGNLNLQNLAMTKYVDKSTVDLNAAMAAGTVFPTITLRVVRPGGPVTQSLQLSNAVLTSISSGGSGGEDRLTENVTFAFSQVTITYTFIDGSGKAGSPESTTLVIPACPGS